MSNEALDFLQSHSQKYLEMAFRTDRCGVIDRPDACGRNTGDCGDTVEIYMTVSNGVIDRVAIETEGCMNTRACANTTAEFTEGRPVSQAWEITPEKIIEYLETLPPASEHCAELAVGALYKALANYNEIRQNPWKKLYR